MTHALVVNADDLGLHPGINAGILRAHREGIVTSASLSVNGAAFEDAVRVAREAPSLDLGVHLTLVGEAPVTPAAQLPTLAPHGKLPSGFPALFRRVLLGRVRGEEIEAELGAQVARARDAGLEITHLDSHQHVHLLPALLPLVVRVANRFGIKRLRAAEKLWPAVGIRSALLFPFARRGARSLRRHGFATPDTFLGLDHTGRLDEATLLALVEKLPPGTSELVCHPGSDDGHIGRSYDWGFGWDGETQALTSPAVREALTRRGIRLVAWRDL